MLRNQFKTRRRGSINSSSSLCPHCSSDGQSLSICNCNRMNIQTLLLLLLGFWFVFVVIFVAQLSKNPSTHSPPSMIQTNIKKPPINNDPEELARSIAKELQILQKNDVHSDTVRQAPLYLKISQKLASQKHLPLEDRRIYSDIKLQSLKEYAQPREVYDFVKQQFKNAEWQPKGETRAPKTQKPVVGKEESDKKDTETSDTSRYKCLYYCDKHNDRDCVLKHIEYWNKPHDNYKNDPKKIHDLFLPEPVLNKNYPKETEGYVTFKSDCGGFNNFRQAYEFIIGVTWLTQRTLVFPVTEGWYLIDWGKIPVDPPLKADGSIDESGVSNYDLFYDMSDLAKVIPIMNLTDFLFKFQSDKEMDLPKRYHIDYAKDKISENWDWGTRQDFKKWQNERSLNKSFAVPYGINHNILLWPNYEDVKSSKKSKFFKNKTPSLEAFIAHRTKREYFDPNLALSTKDYIHFPSCVNGEMTNYRYLGQVATAIGFADFELEKKYKKLIRDHSHFVPQVFEIASFMISYLGLFEYTSAHIRRNDFQFKNSWVDPSKSFKNMEEFSDPKGEVIYIASDAEKGFFANISTEFKDIKKIVRWNDFVKKGGSEYDAFKKMYGDKLDVSKIPRKLVGLIEMVIAAGAKRFFGTTSSTFSAYITRLRGYIDAPDQEIYFHNKQGRYDFHWRPTEYMIEMKDMWLDIKDYC